MILGDILEVLRLVGLLLVILGILVKDFRYFKVLEVVFILCIRVVGREVVVDMVLLVYLGLS